MRESKINSFREILKRCHISSKPILIEIKSKNRKKKMKMFYMNHHNQQMHISKDPLLNMNQVKKISLV
jgi:hypothetical protein